MAAITPTYVSGYLGSVTVDGVNVCINKWDMSHETQVLDFTSTCGAGYQEVERGIIKASGSFVAVWKVVSGAPQFLVGSKYPLVLKTQTAQSFNFNGLIKSNAVSVDIKGMVTFTCNFESDGAITLPTS